jgi:hypothetical protein
MRKPISALMHDNNLLVVCDDGSIHTFSQGEWYARKPVPGTKADSETKKQVPEQIIDQLQYIRRH